MEVDQEQRGVIIKEAGQLLSAVKVVHGRFGVHEQEFKMHRTVLEKNLNVLHRDVMKGIVDTA